MARMAQYVAEAVAVLCPYCGETQPARSGSEFWTDEDFGRASGVRACCSCEEPIQVVKPSMVRYP